MSEAESLAQKEKTPLATRGSKRKQSALATRGGNAQMPGSQNDEKPPKVAESIEWVQQGAGWACREIYYIGGRRRRRHVGHLGRKRYEELRADATPDELQVRLFEWIEERKFEKGLAELSGEAEQRPVM